MTVSSLVITIRQPFDPRCLIEKLDGSSVTWGEAKGAFLPVITEAESWKQAMKVAESFRDIDGVLDVQLISVCEEEEEK